MKKYLILFLFLLNVKLFAQVPEPVNDQTKPVLIYNAFIHIGDGNTIQNGFVSFDNLSFINLSYPACFLVSSDNFPPIFSTLLG